MHVEIYALFKHVHAKHVHSLHHTQERQPSAETKCWHLKLVHICYEIDSLNVFRADTLLKQMVCPTTGRDDFNSRRLHTCMRMCVRTRARVRVCDP